MTPWESDWFNQLGNQIMNQLVSEVDPSDPQELELLGDDTKEKRDKRMMMLKEDGKAATTGHGYGDYPWDPVSLNSRRSATRLVLYWNIKQELEYAFLNYYIVHFLLSPN